jgi:acyl-CoA thioesterase I
MPHHNTPQHRHTSFSSVLEALDAAARSSWVGLGDSLTSGWMVDQGFYDRFIALLKRRFPRASIVSRNAGIPGNTAADGLARLDDVLMNRPDVVTIQFGLNDLSWSVSETDFEQTISTIAKTVLSHNALPVLLTSCPLNWAEGDETATRFYDRIRKVGDALDIPCISLDRFWKASAGPPSDWSGLVHADNVHPTDKGHALMAEGILEHLLRHSKRLL